MNCPHCKSKNSREIGTTKLGYKAYKCKSCKREYNERTNTKFNFLEFSTDIVLLAVLSLRDIAEMFLERGFEFTHEAVRNWVDHFSLTITKQLRKKRRRKASKIWYVGGAYVKKGKFCYLH